MKELIWKEWRENLKWIPLPGLVILLVFLIDKPDEPMPDFTGAFLLCLTAVAFAAALGFVQIFFEAKDDKRSVLLHRPLSRSRIFVAKAIAGVGLYLLALGVPFACLESWLATPGNIPAPYQWSTSLPWLADILSGLVYYFAGMLVAQREARWYGSRCLALAAAFCCSYLVWTLNEFWQALAAIGIIGPIVAVAAWGGFCSGGAYLPQPRLAKAALGMTFLAGLLCLSALGKQRIGEWLDAGIEYEYSLDRQGRMLFQRFKAGFGVIGPVTDLNGQPVVDYKGIPTESAPIVFTETPVYWGYRNNGRFYVRCVNDSKPSNERWMYDHVSGRLLGYDVYYNQLLGSFGPNGFTPAGQQPDERFHKALRFRSNPRRGLPVEFLIFPDAVYTVDLSRRAIRRIFASPTGESVAYTSRWSDPLDKKQAGLIVSTDRSFHFLTEEGVPVVTVPRLYDREKYRTVFAGRLEKPERYVIWYQSWVWWTTSVEPQEYKSLPSYYHEYDPTGREIAHQTVPPPPYADASYSQALFGLFTPMTEAATLVGACRLLRSEEQVNGDMKKGVLLFYLEDIKYCIPTTAADKRTPGGLIAGYLALILLAATASALGCLVLARRSAFSRARCIRWALCGLLFGLPGFLLMIALLEWPARIACPKCRHFRVVTRDTCEHCGAPHAPPAPDGTEIFEPTTTVPCTASAAS